MSPRALVVSALFVYTVKVAGEEMIRPAAAIQDNSFFVEEAYNQEAGVVQHILTMGYDLDRQAGPDDRTWNFSFTQEWPFPGQRHQVSYTVPYLWTDGSSGRENGFGDVMLNYRLQALFESDTVPAFAPRYSLILPTGDESKGLGDDTVGHQFNLPLSKIVHDRWTAHANAGLTLFPDLNDRNPVTYHLGASTIYALSDDFNLMLEFIGEWSEEVTDSGNMDRGFQALISPGMRYAFNRPTSQWVLGFAIPVGLTASSPDFGVFLYASFEHVFRRTK